MSNRAFAILSITSFFVIALFAWVPVQVAKGATPIEIKYHDGVADTYSNVFSNNSQYQYYKIRFDNTQVNKVVVSGLSFLYSTEDPTKAWTSRFEIADVDTAGKIIYEELLPAGTDKTYQRSFMGPDFMVTSADFDVTVFPNMTETRFLAVKLDSLTGGKSGHTSFKNEVNPDWTSLPGYDLFMSAMVESIGTVTVGGSKVTSSVSEQDSLDVYSVNLEAGKNYIFTFSSTGGEYVAKLYPAANLLVTPSAKVGPTTATTSQIRFSPSIAGEYYLAMTYPNNKQSATYTVDAKVNRPPVAEAGPNQVSNKGVAVTFDGGDSSDPDADTLNWTWDFDSTDGNSTVDASGKNPGHVFLTEGSFTVTLTVSDGMEKAMDTMTVRVNTKPKLAIQNTKLQTGEYFTYNMDYYFTAFVVDPDRDNMTFTWDWGDGATNITNVSTVSHKWVDNTKSSYDVTCTASDGYSTDMQTVTLQFRVAPKITLTGASTLVVGDKTEYKITVESFQPGAPVIYYEWDFDGDGVIDEETSLPNATTIYHTAGDYSVKAYAIDLNGVEGSATVALKVSPRSEKSGPDVKGQEQTMNILAVIIVILALVGMIGALMAKGIVKKPSRSDRIDTDVEPEKAKPEQKHAGVSTTPVGATTTNVPMSTAPQGSGTGVVSQKRAFGLATSGESVPQTYEALYGAPAPKPAPTPAPTATPAPAPAPTQQPQPQGQQQPQPQPQSAQAYAPQPQQAYAPGPKPAPVAVLAQPVAQQAPVMPAQATATATAKPIPSPPPK